MKEISTARDKERKRKREVKKVTVKISNKLR